MDGSQSSGLWLRINVRTLAYHLGCIVVKCHYIKVAALTVSTLVGSDPSRRDGGSFQTIHHLATETWRRVAILGKPLLTSVRSAHGLQPWVAL